MAVVQLETGDHQPENGFVTPETASPGLLTRIDDPVLPFLGGFGKYQKQLIVLTWIPALFIGFSQYSDDFLLAQPNNTCPNLTNYNMAQSLSLEASVRENTSSHNDLAGNEWTFEVHTGLVQNVVTQWSLVCDSAWKVHIAKFSLLVGSIFGYLVFGILADWFGRHPGLIISVLFLLVFGLTVAFSVNVTMFSTMRFFEGFCLAGITLSLYVLRIELCLPKWRFSMTMVAIFVVLGGQFLMPGVAYLCRNWQVLQAVIICPLLLMLSYIWIFPESLRWLLATQHYCRSKWIMGHIAEKNGVNMELDPDNILTELQMALQKKPKKTCIVKMVGTRNLWKNIVVLCVNSLTGCGIHHCFARSMMGPDAQETTIFHDFYTNYFMKAGIAVTSCILLCPAVAMMGRRGGLLMFMIITALASLLQLGLLNLLGKYSNHLKIDLNNTSTLNRNFSVAFSIIGMFSSDAVKILSIFFCAEITPTVIRGGGLGLVLASAGFGSLTAPIMELHNQKGYFLHHIIFACCTLICIICILLLPEPRNQFLPETLADGESYTRQPLLPPRKSGEQCSLLPYSASTRDYTKEQDTPHPLGPSGAVSTMGSTVSSAVDLTAPMAGDMPAHTHPISPIEPKDPNGHAVSSSSPASGTVPDITPSSKEHLLSSSPLHKAPCITDPLLWGAEDVSANPDLTKSPTDCIALEINDIAPSPISEENSGPAASLDSSPPVTSQTPSPSSLICTTPIIEPPPSSTLESPNLQDIDTVVTPQLETADEVAVTPPIRDSQPPDLDLASACVKDSSVHSSPHVLPVTDIVQTSTPESTSPNVTDIIADSTISVVLDSITSPSADSGSTEPAPSFLIDTTSSPIDSGFLPISEGETVSTGNNTVNST